MPSHDTLPTIPGDWSTREISVGDATYRLALPAEPDAFLDDPKVLAAHERDDYMPYWSYLWPAAQSMSEAVARHEWTPGTEALEIGAGVGLVGIVALSHGLNVTLSDYDQTAVDVALHNARLNGFPVAHGLRLDWRNPPAQKYPLIFGCDVLYEARNHGPILGLIEQMLTADGVCWLGDGGRQLAGKFIELARSQGFRVELRDRSGDTIEAPHVGRFQLIVLTRESQRQ